MLNLLLLTENIERLVLLKKVIQLVSAKNKPIDYGFIEEKDVLRSMVVWEIIDMNEKINQPFYHNADGIVSQNKSLYQLLLDNIMMVILKKFMMMKCS
jgi:hypothetical protein